MPSRRVGTSRRLQPELDPTDVLAGAPTIHARGTRVLTDVFGADLGYLGSGSLTGYGDALDRGADILQCDRPDGALALFRARGLR